VTSDIAGRDLRAQLREVLVQRQSRDLAATRAVDVDHVDVGGEVELLAAELPSRSPRVSDPLVAVVVGVARRAVARAQLAVVERDRGVEAGIGQPRELAADLGVDPQRELADAEADQLVRADPPQRGAQLAARGDPVRPRGLPDRAGPRAAFPIQVGVLGDPDPSSRVTQEQHREVGAAWQATVATRRAASLEPLSR